MCASAARGVAGLPDPDVCAKEPIHIPGAIEPAGVLLIAEETSLQVGQVSANTAEHLGQAPEEVMGKRLHDLFEAVSMGRLDMQLRTGLPNERPKRVLQAALTAVSGSFDVTLHRRDGLLYLELEPSIAEAVDPRWTYETVSNAVAELRGSSSVEEICQRAVRYIRVFTGFDRVMAYRFLEDESGEVLAEEKQEGLTPYLGQRYPASDIPAQARALYLKSGIRLKPDVNAAAVPLVPDLNPVTGKPPDLGMCILRRMSPVHDQYLRNMGVAASMSLSIVKGQRLWGLIACHHTTAKWVRQVDRIACELLADNLSSAISSKEDEQAWSEYTRASEAYARVERSVREHREPLRALVENAPDASALFRSSGLAVGGGDQVRCAGTTPSPYEVQQLIAWLATVQKDPVLTLESLRTEYPAGEAYQTEASGLLSIQLGGLNGEFIVFFRPELVTEVRWGGDPRHSKDQVQEGQISPRRSFQLWKETVSGRSRGWTSVDRQFATSLRAAVAEAQLAEQNRTISRLNTELSRSNIELDAYAYVAGHDLQEPIRTVKAYAQLLKRTKAEQLDREASELVDFVIQGSDRMHSLVAGLLEYSRVGGVDQKKEEVVSLEDTLNWTLMNLASSLRENNAQIRRGRLAAVVGDPARLMQVFQNVLSNALRYRSAEPPVIEITGEQEGSLYTVHVRDNGIGFEPRFSEEIFGLFKRLHVGGASGTGIGLATCRKIVEQYGGRMWATSEPGKGSTFSFTLPLPKVKG